MIYSCGGFISDVLQMNFEITFHGFNYTELIRTFVFQISNYTKKYQAKDHRNL